MIIALIPTITTSNLENLFQQTFIVNYKKKKHFYFSTKILAKFPLYL
jgi:hypothetical protein